MPRVVVVADDLTGANVTAAQPKKRGFISIYYLNKNWTKIINT